MMIWKNRLFVALIISLSNISAFAAEVPEETVKIRQSASDYEHGRNGIKQDYRQAFTLYCQLALKGDTESAYSMGFMYFFGRGMPHDLSRAVRWFKQAADGGDLQARQMLVKFQDVTPVDDASCKPAEPVFKPFNPLDEQDLNRQKIAVWVNQIAPRYGIDPLLVMAVIQAESAFNPAALSTKNAQGLMQLIPETAERFGVKDSWNPIQNIRGGTAYLHWLLRHFQGKVDWVLAAYNAGEGAVERYNGIPPYQETQAYVRQILAKYPKSIHPIPAETIENTMVIEGKI